MRVDFDGASVLITGASSGLGESMARQLAPRVATLWLVARRTERLEALASELREANPGRLQVSVRTCDLADAAATACLVDEATAAGGVDVLINNAGFGDYSAFHKASWEKLARMIEVNVRAPLQLAYGLLAGMVERRKGGVLNVSSGFGLQFAPGFATYVGTKHFITGFSESLRLEVAARGIVVSQVCPGPVDTEFHDHVHPSARAQAPEWMSISAEQCAREALEGFERGKALIVPGGAMRALLGVGAATPRPLLRQMYGSMSRRLPRRSQRAAQ